MRVLGVSCDYHDAAAALVVDGDIVAACDEERFSRHKHDSDLPVRAIASCLAIGGLEPDDLDAVVMYEKPLGVVGRVVSARQRRGPRAIGTFAREMPVLLGRNLMVGYRLDTALRRLGATRSPAIRYGEHHLSHAAAAFLPSPFPTAAILTIDGIGEWATATVGQGLHHRIDLLEELRYPNSLGLLYSLATVWCGFEANDGEYKLMGLAPFGEPRFAQEVERIAELHEDGSVSVAGRSVNWWGGNPRRMRRLCQYFDGPPRRADEPLGQREADIARSVQDYAETAVLRMAHHAAELTGESTLCMAGGVALNCVANGRIVREGPFDELWVQPAAGDAGSAVGAALWYWHDECGGRRDPRPADGAAPPDAMAGAQLGPRFTSDEVAGWLDEQGIAHERIADESDRCARVAGRLADGEIVGWFHGGMEYGPRALGHRSILADPRSATVQRDLNLRVKGRESFRPFAPAVMWEHATEWFELDRPSPYMLLTCQVAASRRLPAPEAEPADLFERVQVPRSEIPACTHIDGSARVQTVHPETKPAFHRLLQSFRDLTGCPVLLNTSFNRAGEPIVCTPDDAVRAASAAGVDLLVLEDCLVELAEATRWAAP